MAKGDKPAFNIKAVNRENRDKRYDVGAIFEHVNDKGTLLSLAPSKTADENAKYPRLKMVILNEDGEDVTDQLFLNVYDNRNDGF